MFLEWPGFNIIKNLFQDLKHAIHARRPKNISELQVFCQEESGKIPKERMERLLKSGYKLL